jgi:hypothetical protein
MTPIWGLMNKLYRTQKTADLCLRLSETSADAINCLVRLLSKHGIELTPDIYKLFVECAIISDKIEEVNTTANIGIPNEFRLRSESDDSIQTTEN